MAQYQILYWKQVPAQVKVFVEGKRPISRPLPDRFQVEIDKIAMNEGLVGTDAYLEHWRWTPKRERAGSPEEVADSLIRELVQESKL